MFFPEALARERAAHVLILRRAPTRGERRLEGWPHTPSARPRRFERRFAAPQDEGYESSHDIQLDPTSTLPTDSTAGTLVGRVWRPELAGPSVVGDPRRRRVRHLALVRHDARPVRVGRSGRRRRSREGRAHRRSRRDPRQHGRRQARSGEALAARADRPAGRQGRGRHLRDLAARARHRGAGARRAGARRASARRSRKRARRHGREDSSPARRRRWS